MNEREINTPEQEPKRSSKKTWLFLGLGVAATGALSYFGWQYWKKHKGATEEDETDAPEISKSIPKPKAPKSTKAAPLKNAAFPFKKGSKGQNVKALQAALISAHGSKILPSGADGIYGRELAKALASLGYEVNVSQSTYDKIVNAGSPDFNGLATKLYRGAEAKDFPRVISILSHLHSVSDYQAVNTEFLKRRLNSVHQTVVNGLLSTFNTPVQKTALYATFLKIGLKNKNGKWSLSGIDNDKLLITTQASKVWKNPKTSVAVPASMVLGKEVARRGNYTVFENEKQYFLVQSAHTNYYTN